MNSNVLVVGAGPVGLTMAAELARYGVSVRIVEKAAQRTDESKAIVMWSQSLEMLEELVYSPQPEKNLNDRPKNRSDPPMKPIRRSRIKPESGMLCLGLL